MFFSKSAALVLALATGFATQAVAYPSFPVGNIVARYPNNAPALPAPEVFPPLKRASKKKGDGNTDVIKITQINIKEIQKGNNVAIVEQVKTVLIENSSNNKKKNKKRKSAYKKKNSKNTTILIVVQKVVIEIADNKGNKVQELIFAQSEIIANKGQKKTDTIMISDASILIASIGGGAQGTGTGTGAAAATGVGTAAAAQITGTGVGNAANATEAVTLADVAPTWTSIDPDPIQALLAEATGLIS
ncbi:uncharacterized protein BDZ99DRAFT_565946 [Mytilinidion resinicola]|uniref:Uncharacterized protein n=1 Tax=Mytilinidion resinicola TaxID=574789 RepID=A0A6A6Z6Z5_9PEZI|nr:uncharacterized protein BDZ99DRAFT_565946 [Mytilinidion resinicola]KAF2816074.1 hypothetical protein BDZ99DRAFT_565946 [Mytilinidion resinicola]